MGVGPDYLKSELLDKKYLNYILTSHDMLQVASVAAEMRRMGCYEISLGDTIGSSELQSLECVQPGQVLELQDQRLQC